MSREERAERVREEELRREPLHWRDRNGVPTLVDRYDRDLARVRADAEFAARCADAAQQLAEMVETELLWGREAGRTLPRRLFSAAATIDKLAARDERIAAALELAEAEEAEKREGLAGGGS